MSRLIGINGLKTAGKDTTYEIVAGLVPGTKRAAFADKLKVMAMLALGYDGDAAALIRQANRLKEDGGYVNSGYDDVAPLSGSILPYGERISGREYLQRFGGHAREVFGESFWVDQVLPVPISDPGLAPRSALQRVEYERMTTVIDPWTLKPRGDFEVLCVTDVRYPNEAERVLDLGGEVWEVQRPGLESDGHASERPLAHDLVTRVIDNSGDMDYLRGSIQYALNA